MNRSFRCTNGGSVHQYCPYKTCIDAAEKCATYVASDAEDAHCCYRQSCIAESKPSGNDIIAHPSHYTDGRRYEPKDVIREWKLNFNLGSAVKYISRAGRKDDILQDLRKARQFLDFEIEALERERSIQDIE